MGKTLCLLLKGHLVSVIMFTNQFKLEEEEDSVLQLHHQAAQIHHFGMVGYLTRVLKFLLSAISFGLLQVRLNDIPIPISFHFLYILLIHV